MCIICVYRAAIVMEYVDGGTLKNQILTADSPIEEAVVVDWVSQVAAALHYIHSMNLLHRDIKSENIFISSTGIVKVGDFGTARSLTNAGNLAETVIGNACISLVHGLCYHAATTSTLCTRHIHVT
jgi:serine/threonine protein kinase